MNERREGFLYINSEILKQEIAVSKKSGWIYSQDKRPDGTLVSYSPAEIKILSVAGVELDFATHKVKVIFGGTIVGCEKRNSHVDTNGQRDHKTGPEGNGGEERDRVLEIF